MLDELLPIIVDVLIKNKEKATLEEICDFCGYDNFEVSKGLNLLTGLSLIRKEEEKGETFYYLIKDVKPIHLAKAAQIGLDLNSFSEHFKFSNKEKALALELTTRADKIKSLDVTKRKPLIQKRGYFKVEKLDDIGDNLLLLFESTNSALYEYIQQMAERDHHLSLLLTLNEEAESSLKHYLDTLK